MVPDMARRAFTQTTVNRRGEPAQNAPEDLGSDEGAEMMMRTFDMWAVVAVLSLAWQESCENPAIFCYRIGREVFVRRAGFDPLSHEDECSIPSGISSMSSMTSRD